MTSNELALRTGNGVAARDPVDSWTGVIAEVAELAKYVAETEFVPKGLRGKPAAITAAILYGREAGIPPMRALQHIYMIDGSPSMSAEQKRAQALAAGHKIVYVETTTTRCIVRGKRKGEEEWTEIKWTMDDAKAAGLAGGQNYRKYPRRMLQARATGELCDAIFPDATGGLPTMEALQDEADAAAVSTNGVEPPKRTARRRSVPAADAQTVGAAESTPDAAGPPEPPLPGEDDYDDGDGQAPDTEGPITRKQLSKIMVLFQEIGWSDRADRLRASSAIVGHELTTANDLTVAEASTLIDTLEKVAAGPDPQVRLSEVISASAGPLKATQEERAETEGP